MNKTIIVRLRKSKDSDSTDDKLHKDSTFSLSGNFLIIQEGDPEEKEPYVRIPYNLDNVVSWGSRKNKK